MITFRNTQGDVASTKDEPPNALPRSEIPPSKRFQRTLVEKQLGELLQYALGSNNVSHDSEDFDSTGSADDVTAGKHLQMNGNAVIYFSGIPKGSSHKSMHEVPLETSNANAIWDIERSSANATWSTIPTMPKSSLSSRAPRKIENTILNTADFDVCKVSRSKLHRSRSGDLPGKTRATPTGRVGGHTKIRRTRSGGLPERTSASRLGQVGSHSNCSTLKESTSNEKIAEDSGASGIRRSQDLPESASSSHLRQRRTLRRTHSGDESSRKAQGLKRVAFSGTDLIQASRSGSRRPIRRYNSSGGTAASTLRRGDIGSMLARSEKIEGLDSSNSKHRRERQHNRSPSRGRLPRNRSPRSLRRNASSELGTSCEALRSTLRRGRTDEGDLLPSGEHQDSCYDQIEKAGSRVSQNISESTTLRETEAQILDISQKISESNLLAMTPEALTLEMKRKWDVTTSFTLLNQERSKRGIKSLLRNNGLDEKAIDKVNQIAAGTKIQSNPTACTGHVLHGSSVLSIYQTVMNQTSNPARADILNPRFEEVGFGIAKRTDGTVYLCQLFHGNLELMVGREFSSTS